MHTALEELLESAAHYVGIFPVVGWAGSVARERTDESAVLDASHIVGSGAGIEAAGPLLLIQPGKGALGNETFAKEIVFRFRTVNPMNVVGSAKLGHLLD